MKEKKRFDTLFMVNDGKSVLLRTSTIFMQMHMVTY